MPPSTIRCLADLRLELLCVRYIEKARHFVARWKYTLRNGLTHGQRHSCNSERHDQASGNPRHHDLAPFALTLKASATLALNFRVAT
jgi:hypothetical protein